MSTDREFVQWMISRRTMSAEQVKRVESVKDIERGSWAETVHHAYQEARH